MSIFIKPLDVQFVPEQLFLIRQEITEFHSTNRNKLLECYTPGNTPIVPSLGYYVPYAGDSFKERNVTSWESIRDEDFDNFTLSKIKMNIDETYFQNLHVVKPKKFFSDTFDKAFKSVIDSVPHEFDPMGSSISVQEMGYSMKFHKDLGVKSRIHIVLNDQGMDYFYTSDGSHHMKFGECFIFEASKSRHGFMSFGGDLRIHIILDVL